MAERLANTGGIVKYTDFTGWQDGDTVALSAECITRVGKLSAPFVRFTSRFITVGRWCDLMATITQAQAGNLSTIANSVAVSNLMPTLVERLHTDIGGEIEVLGGFAFANRRGFNNGTMAQLWRRR